MDVLRWVRHWFHAPASRAFPPETMREIQAAIADGECKHDGEICFVIEARLPARYLLGGRPIRARADSVFGDLKVWDTDRRTGVLVYVLLADHAIEIVPDRGVGARVPEGSWERITADIAAQFREERWREGALSGIAALHALLEPHLPPDPDRSRNEPPHAPVML